MGKLFVVGVGSGNIEDMTIKSDIIIKTSDFVYCDSKLYENIKNIMMLKKLSLMNILPLYQDVLMQLILLKIM